MKEEMEICEVRWHDKINLIKIYKGENEMKFSFSFSHTHSFSHITFSSSLSCSLSLGRRCQGVQEGERTRHVVWVRAQAFVG